MKKINSINYGGRILGAGLIFAGVIPAASGIFNRTFNLKILEIIKWTSLAIGIVILIIFAVLLITELRQDKKIDRYYAIHKNIRLPLGNGAYECGACGNRQVKAGDNQCMVCGITFENYTNRTPQEIVDER